MLQVHEGVCDSLDLLLLEFEAVPQIHELSLRLLRNLLDAKLVRPSKLIEMKGLNVSRALNTTQKAAMTNNTLVSLKASIVQRLAGKSTLINRFIYAQKRLISDMLR